MKNRNRLGNRQEFEISQVFLERLKLTKEEWERRHKLYKSSKENLNAILQDDQSSVVEKHHALASHYKHYLKTLYICQNCWLLPQFCICDQIERKEACSELNIWILMHHHEFGRATNTGIVLKQTLGAKVNILVKGYKDDERKLQNLFDEKKTVILWPASSGCVIDCEEAVQMVPKDPLNVVVIDATWNCARKIAGKLPKNIPRLRLPSSAIDLQGVSLLFPARKYRGDVQSNGRVCTLEAVAALYRGFGEPSQLSDTLLKNLKLKVNAICHQSGREIKHIL